MRRIAVVLLLLQVAAAGVLDSAAAQEPSSTSYADRLRDLLSARQFGAEVCLRDVNGNGTEDLLVVHRTGPPGTPSSAENVTAFQKGYVPSVFTIATLDGVLQLRRDSLAPQSEYVYLRVFDRLYEVPISAVASCRGSVDDLNYRGCLMRGFFTREKTDAYPTLPSCPRRETP
jgi:hypothetical protein